MTLEPYKRPFDGCGRRLAVVTRDGKSPGDRLVAQGLRDGMMAGTGRAGVVGCELAQDGDGQPGMPWTVRDGGTCQDVAYIFIGLRYIRQHGFKCTST